MKKFLAVLFFGAVLGQAGSLRYTFGRSSDDYPIMYFGIYTYDPKPIPYSGKQAGLGQLFWQEWGVFGLYDVARSASFAVTNRTGWDCEITEDRDHKTSPIVVWVRSRDYRGWQGFGLGAGSILMTLGIRLMRKFGSPDSI